MAHHRGPRVVLAIGVVAGVAHAVLFPLQHPAQVALATDVYYHAARQFLTGAAVYGSAPPAHPGYTFNYPPLVLLAFLPHALTGSPLGAYLLQTTINLVAATTLAVIVIRFLADHTDLHRLDLVLIAGISVASVPMISNLVMGQVNVEIALALGVGVGWFEAGRTRIAGTAFGAAAAIKLFPTMFGAWLLRRRAWEAIAVATATGTIVVIGGVLAFGWGTTQAFFTHILTRELPIGTFQQGPDPTAPFVTIRRQLAYLVPGRSALTMLLVGAVVLTPIVVGVNWWHDTVTRRMVGLLGTTLATLILFPLEPFYLAIATFPLVTTLYLLDPGLARTIISVGTVPLLVPITASSLTPLLQSSALPPPIGTSLVDLTHAVFAVALPPTIGVWLVFLGCLLVQYRAGTDDHASPGDDRY